MTSVLELVDVRKRYQVGPIEVDALKGVHLDVQPGDLLSIMGSSGSGKSTLMNIIGLLDRPTSGACRLNGREVADMTDNEQSDYRNAQIGFVFQSFHLLPQLTAAENVGLPLVYRGWEAADIADRAKEVLDKVGMAERLEHRPNELSGGQQQRVAIARALVGEPALLLADEPTGALDSATGREVMRLLRGLNEDGLTILMVTHDPSVAGQCRRRTHLDSGMLREEGVA